MWNSDYIMFIRNNARWLGAGGLLVFCSSFGQTFFISVFAGNIRADFGLSHGEWGSLYALGTLASAAVMIWAGGLADRYRMRNLGAVVLLGLALSCLLMAQISVVWMLPVTVFCLRLFGQGMASHLPMIAMSRWFVATRGRAISIASLGFALGEALLPLLFVFLLSFVAWQSLWLFGTIFLIGAAFLLRFLLIEERTPQSLAKEQNATGMNGQDWTRAMALKDRSFWLIVPALLGPSCFITAFFFHQVHIAEVGGWSHLSLVALFPLFTFVAMISMLLFGVAVDRFGTTSILPFYQIPMALGFLTLALIDSFTGLAISLCLFAVTVGANSPVPPALLADIYGTRHLGTIKAATTAVMVLGSAIGPILTGLIIDAGLPFADQGVLIACAFGLICMSLTFAARRAKSGLAMAA